MAEIGIKCRWFNATAVNVLCVYKGLPSGQLSASKLFASNPVVYQSWVFLLLLESHMFVVGEEAERSLQRVPGVGRMTRDTWVARSTEVLFTSSLSFDM